MAASNQVSARCKHCGGELVPDHKGPCPQCGQVGKEIIVAVGTAVEVNEALSVSWTKTRHHIETRPVQAALWGIVTVGSPFLGLVLAGWPGALAGLGLTAVGVVLGFYAVTRVREIERGGQ